ncbi:hypothetical protein GQX73_g5960 [Xylaria multiplex]|uniref:F-box domain-containing protein n=1 Tax=Xylaria multiplex TaxID=323545 RepID=A0A7C8IQE6_9PEZI|nr:hypothetical protein GQX73_g5960 [Xylaria multiplex]
MVEVMRISSQGQYPSDAMDMGMVEMSSRLMNTTLGSVSEELKKGLPRDSNSKNAAQNVPPRRAFTTANYLLPTPPISRAATPSVSPQESVDGDSDSQTHLTPPRSPYLSPSGTFHRLPQPAHRSYSVMDYEPIPFTHLPGTKLQLSHLPVELHYALFEFLDPIDSVCLALTSRHFYAVHWNMHGKVSLAVRREGPNDMEWVWRHAGPFLLNHPNGVTKQNSLAMLSPRGQVYCRKCRTERCELHKHIKEWIGGGLEYCVVTEKFGPPAYNDAKGFCYRSSPRHPNRCGRHTRNQRTVRLA